jgi:hypothetical protein
MANLKTIRRTGKIWGRVNEILWPFRLDGGAVVFDGKGIVENPGGTLGDLRRKNGPGVLELTYRELSDAMLKKFVRYTPDPIPEPTEKEWIIFERKLLGTASRVIYREFRKRRARFPRTASREKRKADRAKIIEVSLSKYGHLGMTEAVRRTARDLRISIPTVWRYARELRSGSIHQLQP